MNVHVSPKCTWISRNDGCNDVEHHTALGRDRLILTGVRESAWRGACAGTSGKLSGEAGTVGGSRGGRSIQKGYDVAQEIKASIEIGVLVLFAKAYDCAILLALSCVLVLDFIITDWKLSEQA